MRAPSTVRSIPFKPRDSFAQAVLLAGFLLVEMNGHGAQTPDFLWVRHAGGTADAAGNAVAVDADGNAYVTGDISSPAHFGTNLVSGSSVFLAKYDSSGNVVWIQTSFGRMGNSRPISARGLALDQHGNLYVTGQQSVAGQGPAVFVAKFDEQGRQLWFKNTSGALQDYYRQGESIAVDGAGNAILVGTFTYGIDFSEISLNAGAQWDGFAAKYNPDGTLVWAKRMGGPSSDNARGVAVDSENNIFVTGKFIGTADFGGIPLPGKSEDNNTFLAKYDENGNVLWARRVGTNQVFGLNVATDRQGNCFVSSVGDVETVPNVKLRLAITKYSRDGVLLWSRTTSQFQISGQTDFYSGSTVSLAVDPGDTVFLASPFAESITFGTNILTSAGGADLLLARLSSVGEIIWAKQAGYVNEETPRGIALDQSGHGYVTGGFQSVTRLGTNYIPALGASDVFLAKFAGEPSASFVLVSVNGQFATRSPLSVVGAARVELSTTFPKGAIFYTLDGTDPSPFSRRYTRPFTLRQNAELRALTYSEDFSQSGEMPPIILLVTPGYALSALTAGGGSFTLNPPGGLYASNASVQVSATPDPGWRLWGWMGDATGGDSTVSLTMNRPRCVRGVFGTTLSTTIHGSGAILRGPAGDVYPYGTIVNMTGVPENGSSFAAWGNDSISVDNPLSFVVTEATPMVSALFVPLSAGTVALTVIPHGHGSVHSSPRGNRFDAGQTLTVTAVPEAGEGFLGWGGDASGAQNPLPLTMNSSKVIEAQFTQRPRLSIEPCYDPAVGDRVRLVIHGEVGARYIIQRSSDLDHWSERGNTTNVFGTAPFTDLLDPKAKARFYRAIVSQ